MVLYLNKDWIPGLGGELTIYNEENPALIDHKLDPFMGNFVVFLSETIFHEVVPTGVKRYSITGWMRYNDLGRDALVAVI